MFLSLSFVRITIKPVLTLLLTLLSTSADVELILWQPFIVTLCSESQHPGKTPCRSKHIHFLRQQLRQNSTDVLSFNFLSFPSLFTTFLPPPLHSGLYFEVWGIYLVLYTFKWINIKERTSNTLNWLTCLGLMPF